MGGYSYSGAPVFTTVATTGNYLIRAYGGQGGGSAPGGGNSVGIRGGLGAQVAGYFTLTAGEQLEIVAGASGRNGVYSGGGGGGSFVLANTGAGGAFVPLLVAGGGGGGFTTAQGAYVMGQPGTVGAPGNGSGGTSVNSRGGGGGAGVNQNGQTASNTSFGGYGGATQAGNFRGGDATFNAGPGGLGGGGGGGTNGGGGGGGYTGGAGGNNDAGGGGTSFDAGTPIASQTLAGVHANNGGVFIQLLCFADGTRIRTSRGDVAVQDLAVGDHTITASGGHGTIRWIGHRRIDCRAHPHPAEVMPIRIATHAFGEARPSRDLFLSPGHPVLVGADETGEGGCLVPIMCLINGTTIARAIVEEITYWHVELDAHDILLAEGLPAESYIDLGSRPWFEGADGVLFDPDFATPDMPGRCRPVVIHGATVEAERRRLEAVCVGRLERAARWPSEAALGF